MGSLSRTVKCSNCESENRISIDSGLEFREITISGKCQNCGSAIQLNFNVVEKEGEKSESESYVRESVPAETINIDDALGTNVTSDNLKDIMED